MVCITDCVVAAHMNRVRVEFLYIESCNFYSIIIHYNVSVLFKCVRAQIGYFNYILLYSVRLQPSYILRTLLFLTVGFFFFSL